MYVTDSFFGFGAFLIASTIVSIRSIPSPVITYPQYVIVSWMRRHWSSHSFNPAVEILLSSLSRLARRSGSSLPLTKMSRAVFILAKSLMHVYFL